MTDTAESLVGHISTCKVSSVLNRDTASYGKRHLFDGSTETCWNSEQGTPQHVLVEFSTPVCISEIRIQFQGGFAGAETRLVDATRAVDICPLHPDDSNKLQSFALPATEQPVSRRRIKILFATSTDFYGRIIVYALDFVGHLAHPDASPANPARSAIATTDPTTSSDNAAVASSDTIVII